MHAQVVQDEEDLLTQPAAIKISDVARATGINRGTLTRLYYETAERIELEVVDQLCGFFGVGVDGLLEYVADEKASRNPVNEKS